MVTVRVLAVITVAAFAIVDANPPRLHEELHALQLAQTTLTSPATKTIEIEDLDSNDADEFDVVRDGSDSEESVAADADADVDADSDADGLIDASFELDSNDEASGDLLLPNGAKEIHFEVVNGNVDFQVVVDPVATKLGAEVAAPPPQPKIHSGAGATWVQNAEEWVEEELHDPETVDLAIACVVVVVVGLLVFALARNQRQPSTTSSPLASTTSNADIAEESADDLESAESKDTVDATNPQREPVVEDAYAGEHDAVLV